MTSTLEHVNRFLQHQHRLWIDGKWSDAESGECIDSVDPSTGNVLSSFAAGGAGDVDRAVRAARGAFEDGRWTDMRPSQRAEVLWQIADLITANLDELALLESMDNGMPLASSRGFHVPEAARMFRYYAGWVERVHGYTSEFDLGGAGHLGYTLRSPVGVVGLIVPWNAPLVMATFKLAPALAAGCTSVLKPAEQTSFTALRLMGLIAEAGVPDGVVNLVTGTGEAAGAALASHHDVDKIAFTGSTEVGRRIVGAATSNLKKVSLELGGKSPVVVFDDADLELAANAAASAIFGNSGQVCTAGSRLIAHTAISDELVAAIAQRASALRLGAYDEPDVEMGPLVSRTQRERVLSYIARGRRDGAEMVVGGASLSRPGYFVEPTVLSGLPAGSSVVREEIFGPVLATMRFDTEDEAVRLANDTRYGLAGSVFTRDVNRAHGVAARLRSGRVGINVHTATHYTMPMGGFKESGWGRENGLSALDAYLETKSVFVPTSRRYS